MEKSIRLRYPGTCRSCGEPQPAGTTARWDQAAKTITCLGCVETAVASPGAAMEGAGTTMAVEAAVHRDAGAAPAAGVDLGEAGRSAEQIAARAKARQEADIRGRFPRIGGALLAVSGDPAATRTYGKGASGERLVGNRLDAVADQGVVALHDRRKPRSRGNIDHIAITPTGVYVIDAKRYRGRLERRDVGGWFRRDDRLYVGGRDRTPLAAAVVDQASVVRSALGVQFDGLPVWPVLCFVDCDASLLLKPFELHGVLVTWPRALQKTVSQRGPVAADTIQAVARHLGRLLPPA